MYVFYKLIKVVESLYLIYIIFLNAVLNNLTQVHLHFCIFYLAKIHITTSKLEDMKQGKCPVWDDFHHSPLIIYSISNLHFHGKVSVWGFWIYWCCNLSTWALVCVRVSILCFDLLDNVRNIGNFYSEVRNGLSS